MTQEEKQLLLKDLCARLPYSVKVDVDFYYATKELSCDLIQDLFLDEKSLRPYLRSMSSMTEKEGEEYRTECKKVLLMRYRANSHYPVTDWLNGHHFDYRGLIEKGLALEAPEGMYKTE